MNELHNEYVKDDHLEEEDDEQQNLQTQKATENDVDTIDEELQFEIMDQVKKMQQKEGTFQLRQDSISEDLQDRLQNLLQKITNQNEEQIVKLRMNQLALSKILVYTHGKSEFRLVLAHHHIGKAYLNYKCYEQAIDHLTLALKKNSKLTQIKETKLYHTYILRGLSKCYYEISSFEDALEVLSKAQDIQNTYYNQNPLGNGQNQKCDVQTLKLIANCQTKLKNYKKARLYFKKALDYCQKTKGQKSKEYAKIKIDEAKTYFQQKDYGSAIQQLNLAIQTLINLNYPNRMQLVNLEDLLSQYYEKNGEIEKQIDTLFAKLQLFEQQYDQSHKNTLKLKRSIVTVLMKNGKQDIAIKMLEEILQSQQKIYGPNSIHVGKTLKMLGINFMVKENQTNSAQHYLKRALKILQQQGNNKLVKQIKAKLLILKQMKEKRINGMIHQQ